MNHRQDEQAQLDAAIDAALDALEDSDDDDDNNDDDGIRRINHNDEPTPPPRTVAGTSSEQAETPIYGGATRSRTPFGPPRPPNSSESGTATTNDWTPEQLFENMMQQIIEGDKQQQQSSGDSDIDEAEFIGRFMQGMQNQIQQEMSKINTEGAGPTSSPPKKSSTATPPPKTSRSKKAESNSTPAANKSKSPSSSDKEELEAAISKLVDGLAQQATLHNDNDTSNAGNNCNGGNDTPNVSDFEKDFLQSLMNDLASAGLGGGDGSVGDDINADAVIDGMMEQLLSKDLMYEPMKQVATKFPDWLKERKDALSAKEYSERSKQCDCFCQLVDVYEREPNNLEKLMHLMRDVQEYGQPPVEIIREIAPGIELDDEGMPKLEGSGLPFGGNEECRIM